MQAMRIFCLACLSIATVLPAQTPSTPVDQHQVWQLQDSGSTASFRGIHSVDGTVAWASGSEGTVLKTTDGGGHWQKCTVPDGDKDGATLDFRGVQAWDSQTAMVMATGLGDKSRLYKTTDGCKTWKLLLKNTDPRGFYDGFWLNAIYGEGILLGDPVNGQFTILETEDGGAAWKRDQSKSLFLRGVSLAAFAASNSSIGKASRRAGDTRGPGTDYFPGFVTGGKGGAFLIERWQGRSKTKARFSQGKYSHLDQMPDWNRRPIPLATGSDGSGAFALALRYTGNACEDCGFGRYWHLIAVGGDYMKPNETTGTAATSAADGGWTWTASTTPPHGYRSTVQWSESQKLWITAGPNGSDISRDDGKTWQLLDNGNWNALSLPFIVGPKGRIARLNPAAMSPANR
jgi:hypothetical protein